MCCLDLFVRATYANDLANEYYDDDGYGPPAPTEYDLEQDKYRVIAMESLLTLTHWLRPLLEIRVKKDFHLRIFFKDGREHQKLEAFRPVVRTFVDAGAHVALLSPVLGIDEHQNVLNYFEMGCKIGRTNGQQSPKLDDSSSGEACGTAVCNTPMRRWVMTQR
jgi:hypothetical protein